MGTTVTNQNSIHEEIKSRLESGNAYYHSVQSLLSSSLLSKNVNIKTYRTIILPVLYGCETWSLTLREECRLRVFDNRVLKRLFGPKRDEVIGEWRRLHNEELYAPYFPPNIIRVTKSRTLRWAGHVACMRRCVVRTEFWWGNLREVVYLKNPGLDGNIILNWIFEEWDGVMGRIDLAQDKDRWRAVVNAVMNLRVLLNVGNF